jgi:energy-coupling factor transport system ATP-binding protein
MIRTKNLTFSYDGEKNALENINLEIRKGDFLGVIGNTGSGKSTLLKHMNAIILPQKGEMNILGRKIDGRSKKLKEIRKGVGVVFQFPENQLFAETIKEDINFGPKNFGFSQEEIDSNLDEIKEILGINEEMLEKSAMELSGGEKRRAAIASIMVSKPDVLVLDEPTIGLDYQNRQKLLNRLEKLNKIGITVIIVSHDLHSVWPFLQRIAILEKGKKVFDGDKVNLLKKRKEFNTFFLPDYIEKLEELDILSGNEERALSKESCLELILEKFGGGLNG